jgi:hypothetical protein
MTLLLHITIGLVLICLYWAWRQPEVQNLITRVCTVIAKWLDENVFSKEYRDEMIRHCIKDSFNMVEQIQASADDNEVETWYWEIDKFDKVFRNNVPDALLEAHCNRLYAACNAKRAEFRAPVVKVFDSPTISLS